MQIYIVGLISNLLKHVDGSYSFFGFVVLCFICLNIYYVQLEKHMPIKKNTEIIVEILTP